MGLAKLVPQLENHAPAPPVRVPPPGSAATTLRRYEIARVYQSGKTLEATGAMFGITRERVRQILTTVGVPSRPQRPVSGCAGRPGGSTLPTRGDDRGSGTCRGRQRIHRADDVARTRHRAAARRQRFLSEAIHAPTPRVDGASLSTGQDVQGTGDRLRDVHHQRAARARPAGRREARPRPPFDGAQGRKGLPTRISSVDEAARVDRQVPESGPVQL